MSKTTNLKTIGFPEWELGIFDRLLSDHVENGRVDYRAFKDDKSFASFIRQIAQMDTQSLNSREKRLVFYINSYNALTIKAVTDGGTPAGFLDRIRFFLFTRFEIGGKQMSLLGLERSRIIPLGEPRAHFPIVCASNSCPVLQSNVYRLETLEDQLESAATRFINDPKQNHFDRSSRTATLSRIFKWYRSEFSGAIGALEMFLAGYIDDPETAGMLRRGEFRIRFRRYDWSLNGTV